MNINKIGWMIVSGAILITCPAYAGLQVSFEYISQDNIGQMAHNDYIPSNNYSYRFVYGAQDIDDGSDFAAVRNAFGTWVDLPSSNLSCQEVIGTSTFKPGEYNGKNEISWISAGYGYDDPWTELLGLSENSIAVAMTWYNPVTKQVLERDLYFNDVYFSWRTDSDGLQTGGFSVEHIALHEIGHLFGLKDVYNPGQTGWESWMGDNNQYLTMYGYSSWKSDDVTLSEEDILAVSLLHPDDSVTVPEPASLVIFMAAGGFLIVGRHGRKL